MHPPCARSPAFTTLRRMTIPYGRQSIDEDDIAAVVEVLRGDWLTQGPAVAAFERRSPRPASAPRGRVLVRDRGAPRRGVRGRPRAGRRARHERDDVRRQRQLRRLPRRDAALRGHRPGDLERDRRDRRRARSASGRAVVPVHYAGLPRPSPRSAPRWATTSRSSRTRRTRSAR